MSNNRNKQGVNSEDYWDSRFGSDWDEKSGDLQSVFFMKIAMEMFPEWLKKYLTAGGKSVCDWGCAEGDGTDYFAGLYPQCRFEGTDFSRNAIASANKRYDKKNLTFTAKDLLVTPQKQKYDIVFSSNVFEHFHDPWDIFKTMSQYAKEIFIMMVPLNEDKDNLVSEHFHSFTPDEFRLQSDEWDIVHFTQKNTAVLPGSYWFGNQALVIYMRKGLAQKYKLDMESVAVDVKNSLAFDEVRFALEEDNSRLRKLIAEQNDLLLAHETQIEKQAERLGVAEQKLASDFYEVGQKVVALSSKILPRSDASYKVTRAIDKVRAKKRDKDLSKQLQLIKDSGLFDEIFYLVNNPDVRASGIDPALHYLKYGFKEGREPSILFDQAHYIARYSDVRNEGSNPLIHYLQSGKREGRSANFPLKLDVSEVRERLVLQIDSFDKGGLEEVVFSLAVDQRLNEKYKIFVFVTDDKNGYMSQVARENGVTVVNLNRDTNYLAYLVERLNVSMVNFHYSTFGINTYKNFGVRTVYTIHNNYVWSDPIFEELRKMAYRKMDAFIAVSSQVGDYFSEKFGVSKDRIDVIPNGVDTSKLIPTPQDRGQYGIASDDFVFVNVASFTPNKFHASLIASFAEVSKKYPKARLLLVGNVVNEDYYVTVKEMIKKYHVTDKVKLIDFLPKDKLLGLLEVSDCFVMPSLTEGFSIAMLEAMHSKLPLVLTDVGGARDVITDSDIGLVVRNTYDNIHDLTNEKISELYMDDSNLTNKVELTSAMTDMIKNRRDWKKKGLLGKKKLAAQFSQEKVTQQYQQVLTNLTKWVEDSELVELRNDLGALKIAFFAPYPTKERVTEGWMSRINAIDKIIGVHNKIYVNVVPGRAKPVVYRHEKHGWELIIGQNSPQYTATVGEIIKAVRLVYVHTLHLAEFALPWLDSDKVVVDIHGITPEEEIMLGRPYLKDKYQEIEQLVLKNAKQCVMVTHAMAEHYKRKYPEIDPAIITLPIVEEIKAAPRRTKSGKSNKLEVVYSGGTQAWQNIDTMLDLASKAAAFARFTFLSHDWWNLKLKGEQRHAPDDTTYEFCAKDGLARRYADFDIGLALRDETPVNRVACPTKLYEYMVCGIVPVVKYEELGDFKKFGYQYVTLEQFNEGKIPDAKQRAEIVNANYRAVSDLKDAFAAGSKRLKRLIDVEV